MAATSFTWHQVAFVLCRRSFIWNVCSKRAQMEKGSKDEAEKGALDIIVQVFGVSFFFGLQTFK